MVFYPDQRYLLELTTIRRERLLPEDAIGDVEVRDGAKVGLRDVVARGVVPSGYVILEAAAALRLKDPDELDALMMVEVGDAVEVRSALAGRAGQRGRRLLSPVKGIVAYVGEGRVIIQQTSELLELEAGVEGQVTAVRPGRGVTIETFGGLVQGVWGNNRRAMGVLRIEPDDGLEMIYSDELDIQFRGAILVTRRPLRATGLTVMADQGFSGIIAPSMEADLIDQALAAEGAVLLTEGFGSIRMSAAVLSLLTGFAGRQAALDALMPGRWDARRPEVIVNPSVRSAARPPRPNPDLALKVGTEVRLTRLPHAGQVGKVVDLPKTPYLLDNGLRVQCALVELLTGERVYVPLVNLESFGR